MLTSQNLLILILSMTKVTWTRVMREGTCAEELIEGDITHWSRDSVTMSHRDGAQSPVL